MKAWIAAQLADPTNAMHALGFLIVGIEVTTHWFTGKPVDAGTIAAGMGCFAVGGVMDHYQGVKPA